MPVDIEYILSDHQRAQIEPLFELLRPVMPPWIAGMSVRYNPDLTDIAQITAQAEYRTAGIKIGDGWFTDTPDEQIVHLIHEIAHCHVAAMSQAYVGMLNALTEEDSALRKWGEEALRIAEEGCVSDLSRVFAALLKQET
jgi:hypothetical protein